ncbi:MAG TPA: ribonuclease D [Mizugakiibacter sp.]|nr:ribonuclease D [Mizugakiibacter sp.]
MQITQQMPTHTQDQPVTWLKSETSARSWCVAINTPSPLALDTEFMRRNTYYPELALVQLSVQGHTALLDPLATHPGPILKALALDPQRICIMHSPGEDLETLREVLPQGPAHLFDTQLAAAFSGLGYGLGYQTLVAKLTGIDLPKDQTRSNWLQRPLSIAQKNYAAQDVQYLETIFDALKSIMTNRGFLEWFEEDCRYVCRRSQITPDPQPQTRFRSASNWPKEAVVLLRRLLKWRDQTARRINRPRPWLLPDELMAELATQPPVSMAELHRMSRSVRFLHNEVLDSLHSLLSMPINEQERSATEPVPKPLDNQGKSALKSMQKKVAGIADDLGLPPAMLGSRRLLDTLLRQHCWPSEVDSTWRRAQLEQPLLNLLP